MKIYIKTAIGFLISTLLVFVFALLGRKGAVSEAVAVGDVINVSYISSSAVVWYVISALAGIAGSALMAMEYKKIRIDVVKKIVGIAAALVAYFLRLRLYIAGVFVENILYAPENKALQFVQFGVFLLLMIAPMIMMIKSFLGKKI